MPYAPSQSLSLVSSTTLFPSYSASCILTTPICNIPFYSISPFSPQSDTVNEHKDQFHERKSGGSRSFVGNSMWVFGRSGVYIYSPAGSKQHKMIPPKDICHMTAGYSGEDETSLSCLFYDVVRYKCKQLIDQYF